MMNEQQPMDLLDQQLQALQDDVPPMPEGFHAGWMKKVEDEAMQKPSKKINWSRILSVAAALVFIVGGTLLTREKPLSAAQNGDYDFSSTYVTTAGSGYSMRSASYDEAYEESYDTGMVMMAKSTAANSAAAPTLEKKIIRSASLSITTQQFDESLAALRQLCEDKGGWISYCSESDSGSRRTASLTLRIPSAELDSLLEGAGGMGRITRREEYASDVTDSYYDTRARLDTQLALMARLQSLVTDAAHLSDLLALESQIADTQYQIDALQASLNSTDSQVDYATVDVSLREELPADSIIDAEVTLGQRILDALETGLEAFVEFLGDMVVFLAAALPFIVLVGIVVLVVKLLRKRRK